MRCILSEDTSSCDLTQQSDFLQGLFIKLRILRRISVDDVQPKATETFDEQVQLKLVQLELNNMRLITKSDSIGMSLTITTIHRLISFSPREMIKRRHN